MNQVSSKSEGMSFSASKVSTHLKKLYNKTSQQNSLNMHISVFIIILSLVVHE